MSDTIPNNEAGEVSAGDGENKANRNDVVVKIGLVGDAQVREYYFNLYNID
jgi:hypothetical protein